MRFKSSLSHLDPVASRSTVGDTVYRALRDALTVGRFDPSQVLTISAMSQAFQTSHMPVREALRRLTAEGALEVGSSGSARVPAVDRKRLDDIIEARVLLERKATMLAATWVTEDAVDELARLARIHSEVANHRDVHDMLLKNRDFHFAIYRASGSVVLPSLIETLWLQYGPYMRMLSDQLNSTWRDGDHKPYALGHMEIVEALRSHDADRAADEVEADIRRTQTQLQAALQGQLAGS
ncbi:GntR family transcriptional regulator [Celeribacter sp.]|uniref:GntR family transcriptional regulator n=1 Tax=Celeribacter sp. TaxID=1890673 RepID=UPI003A92363E